MSFRRAIVKCLFSMCERAQDRLYRRDADEPPQLKKMRVRADKTGTAVPAHLLGGPHWPGYMI